jgi:hypothetical protein
MAMHGIEMDDASQLSLIAYEKSAYGRVEGGDEVIKSLSSDIARQIAAAIIDPASPENLDPEVKRAVDYFDNWARETSARAQRYSRRPSFPRGTV